MAKKLPDPYQYPEFNLHDLRHDKEGREHLDPTPMEPPLGYKKQQTLSDQIRNMIYQSKMSEIDNSPETMEEADDFDMEDDFDPHSRWENDFEPSIKELKELYDKRTQEEARVSAPPEPSIDNQGSPSVPSEPPHTP